MAHATRTTKPAADFEYPSMTRQDVAAALNVSPRTVDNLRVRGELTAYVRGSIVRFRPSDVAALLEAEHAA